ncbi:MAG: hypothetical protein ACRDDM_07805 [Paraclostridium sp.]
MKKNKTLAYTLAATLLLGGAFVGTKAWFTHESKLSQKVQITMGELKTGIEYNGAWQIKPDNDLEYEVTDLESVLKNVTPGTKMTRNVIVSNKGSLDLDGIIQVKQIEGLDVNINFEGASYGDVEIEKLQDGTGYSVKNMPGKFKAGETEQYLLFKVSLEVPLGAGEDNTTQGQTIVDVDLDDFVTVKATQKGVQQSESVK